MNYNVLLKTAYEAMEQAYAPYSGVKVGAALLTYSGEVYTGSNVENASYGASICAERAAVLKAVNAGYTSFTAIAVVSNLSGYTYPCGICRQVLTEFVDDMDIILSDGSHIKILRLKELFPYAFKIK
ncbi:MAG TPA: cytidine deaminase [Firmicutes bacterium]|nr:cytidine deaminase [Bacillota bacterium]